MKQTPILFLTGLSGVGKTTVATWVAGALAFAHFNIDRDDGQDGIDVHDLRSEWNSFRRANDATRLARSIRIATSAQSMAGAVLSFPSTAPFHLESLNGAAAAGIVTLVLHGTPDECLEAFLEREASTGRGLSAQHWRDNNRHAIDLYTRSEYAGLLLPMFKAAGQRRSRSSVLGDIRRRLAAAY